MNEPTPLAKAEAAVTEAATNTDVIRLALAAVELAKTAQQQAPACGHHHQAPDFNAKKWVTIGSLVVACGCVACFLAAALAVLAVAVSVGAITATAGLLILRALWRDLKGR